MSMDPARHDNRAAVGDRVDEIQNITTAQVRNLAMAPKREHIPIANSLYRGARSVLRLISLQPLLGNASEARGRPFAFAATGGVPARLSLYTGFSPGLARSGQRHGRVTSQC